MISPGLHSSLLSIFFWGGIGNSVPSKVFSFTPNSSLRFSSSIALFGLNKIYWAKYGIYRYTITESKTKLLNKKIQALGFLLNRQCKFEILSMPLKLMKKSVRNKIYCLWQMIFQPTTLFPTDKNLQYYSILLFYRYSRGICYDEPHSFVLQTLTFPNKSH